MEVDRQRQTIFLRQCASSETQDLGAINNYTLKAQIFEMGEGGGKVPESLGWN